MTQPPSQGRLSPLLMAWGTAAIRYPLWVLLFFAVSAGLTLKYTLDHLKVNTNTADMISLEVPFQKRRLALEKAFPQDIGTGLLLVEGPTPEQTQAALDRLVVALKGDPAHFRDVTVPDGGPFFNRNGLLFLPLEDLERLTVRLSEAQPFIGRLSREDSLKGYLGLLEDAFRHPEDAPSSLDPLITALTQALDPAADPLSWQQRMNPEALGFGYTQRFIVFRPVLHYDAVMPAEATLTALNDWIGQILEGDLAKVKVLKTGEFILEHEEMETISNGVSAASLASLILVCLTLGFAYRSAKLVLSTFITLSLGLIYSLGFATVAIGQLNLISIGFAVLFIGMGDAYSSHFCLRYRELVLKGYSTPSALKETLGSTGPALTLSAVTAALGLFAFIPTSYSGVAELGIIAGASMFIALITTFTLLPALMRIMPLRPSKKARTQKDAHFALANAPLKYARAIRWVTLGLTLGSLFLVFQVVIDFNPLNLRDPNTESVQTFKALLKDEHTSPMTLSSLAQSAEDVQRLKTRYQKNPSVNQVLSVFDLIPPDQTEKLALIEDLQWLIGPALEAFPETPSREGSRSDLKTFQTALKERRQAVPLDASLKALDEALDAFSEKLDRLPATEESALKALDAQLIAPLTPVLKTLKEQLKASPISLETLPQDLKERWLSPEGLYRIQITPKEDLGRLEALRTFILEAQAVDPEVTDLPVTYFESMNEVIKAFEEAFGIALVATFGILLLVLRSLRDTLLVLLPLLLASLLTAATTVLLGVPFNFANIIALPLLFGLGVDSGIHIAHRLHAIEGTKDALLDSSEARGVFFGALTTVFSFSSLALTPHQGTASMGLLLAIGLMITLFAALLVLPAFSPLGRSRARGRRGVKSTL